MPFAILALDKPGSGSVRTDSRPAHLEHLDRYAPKLLAGGAIFAEDGKTPIGSLIIFDSEDRAEVETFMAADPFSNVDLFASMTIYPWRKVFVGGVRQS